MKSNRLFKKKQIETIIIFTVYNYIEKHEWHLLINVQHNVALDYNSLVPRVFECWNYFREFVSIKSLMLLWCNLLYSLVILKIK